MWVHFRSAWCLYATMGYTCLLTYVGCSLDVFLSIWSNMLHVMWWLYTNHVFHISIDIFKLKQVYINTHFQQTEEIGCYIPAHLSPKHTQNNVHDHRVATIPTIIMFLGVNGNKQVSTLPYTNSLTWTDAQMWIRLSYWIMFLIQAILSICTQYLLVEIHCIFFHKYWATKRKRNKEEKGRKVRELYSVSGEAKVMPSWISTVDKFIYYHIGTQDLCRYYYSIMPVVFVR